VGKVLLGVVAGLAFGVAVVVAISVPGILFLAPVTMIGGGVLGAWWGEHTAAPRRTVPHG
jgi:hypothetical protein